MLLFNRLSPSTQRSIVQQTYEIPVPAGRILIHEGDTGLAASELYIIKTGEFEVLQQRHGVNIRVNMKSKGDVFGEVALMYNCPRSATVAATKDSVVWVLERDVFRQHVQAGAEEAASQIELFLNSVPILSSLSKEEKLTLLGAFEEKKYSKGEAVVKQGEPGDFFYIIKEGEATVYVEKESTVLANNDATTINLDDVPEGQETTGTGTNIDPIIAASKKKRKKVNQLFRSDFFGEQALLSDIPRAATVEAASTPLVVLALDRGTFTAVLGSLEKIMQREKSAEVVKHRLIRLASGAVPARVGCEVLVKRVRRRSTGQMVSETVRARGHLDEVLELKMEGRGGGNNNNNSSGGDNNIVSDNGNSNRGGGGGGDIPRLVLIEGQVVGGGAFSRVSIVTEENTKRRYALKKMRKAAVVNCPDHVFSEQAITRNLAHPFCIRQYASFQDKHHLYFLFDLLPGGDLMDVLVAEASVGTVKNPSGARRGVLAPNIKVLFGMSEHLARFYIASLVLALDYLHSHDIVYRDLKPENVFIDETGYIKLGDFGFAKTLPKGKRTYTFCGTPGYVAPENILAHGYNSSVDWWGLGVLTYVLLTGRQPFSTPKTDDPMVVMRRIVDDGYVIPWPPYVTLSAKSLILQFMERKPSKRLGMLAGGVEDIKKHPWFEGFDWDALAARKIAAPRLPKQKDSEKRVREQTEMEENKVMPRENPDQVAEYLAIFKEV
jgi:cGMP-dependent protein kinase 2